MISGDTRHQSKILFEVPAHPLAKELFPAIAVLRHGRISVGFFQAGHIRVGLFVLRVHAGGGGEEKPLDAGVQGGQGFYLAPPGSLPIVIGRVQSHNGQ